MKNLIRVSIEWPLVEEAASPVNIRESYISQTPTLTLESVPGSIQLSRVGPDGFLRTEGLHVAVKRLVLPAADNAARIEKKS
jgi:hypothetical protein